MARGGGLAAPARAGRVESRLGRGVAQVRMRRDDGLAFSESLVTGTQKLFQPGLVGAESCRELDEAQARLTERPSIFD